jgi:hypothetical protein
VWKRYEINTAEARERDNNMKRIQERKKERGRRMTEDRQIKGMEKEFRRKEGKK